MTTIFDLPDEVIINILSYDLSLTNLIKFVLVLPQFKQLAFNAFYRVITIDPFKSDSQGINPFNVFQTTVSVSIPPQDIPPTYLNFMKLHGDNMLRRMTSWQYLEFYREYGPVARRLRFVQMSDMIEMHRHNPFLLDKCILEMPIKSMAPLNAVLPNCSELYHMVTSPSPIPTYLDIITDEIDDHHSDKICTLEEPEDSEIDECEYEPETDVNSIILDQLEERLHRVKLPSCVTSLEAAVNREDSNVVFADKVSVASCTNLTKLIVKVKKLTWDFGFTPHLAYFEFFGKELDVVNSKTDTECWQADLIHELNLSIQKRTNWHLSHFPKLCQLYLELDRDVKFDRPLGSLSQCRWLRIIQLQLMCGYLPFLPELPTHIKVLFVWCLSYIELDISKCSDLVYAYINLPKPIVKHVLESLPIPLLMTSEMV